MYLNSNDNQDEKKKRIFYFKEFLNNNNNINFLMIYYNDYCSHVKRSFFERMKTATLFFTGS